MNHKVLFFLFLSLTGGYFFAGAQGYCPTNIDFELGTTSNWNYFRGYVSGTATAGPTYVLSSSPAVNGLHTLVSGTATDHYGGFPVVAPSGGSYSLKLGHDTTNYAAERALYYVHIPSGSAVYSLVYHYAAVLENPTATSHTSFQMPRLVVDAYDSSTGTAVPCISYTYVSSSTLPGFIHSTVTSTVIGNGTDVYYKPWTLGNMKFPGLNGHTVAVEFTANGCTQGGHFGYGYIDMSCGLFATSILSCGSSTATVSAPPGYASYAWYDSTTFATYYGSTPTVTLTVSPSTITYAVICTPFTGYGCPDTLYTHIVPTSLTTAPSHDTAICAGTSVSLSPNATDISLPLTYSWTPSAGLSCATCSTVTATPTATTAYSVTTTDGGGCQHTDVMNVTVYPNPAAITGISSTCVGSTTTLADATSGGHWTSSGTTVATVGSASGAAGGVSAGTATISYSYGPANICAVTAIVSVNPIPPSISGNASVCVGATSLLTDGAGTWSSSNTLIASVDIASGNVSGIAAGTAVITYTATTGCSKTIIVTVNPLPNPITGAAGLCPGGTTMADVGGGSWSISNSLLARIGSGSGIVSGVASGTDTVIYTLPTGCSTGMPVTIYPLPLPINDSAAVCIGSTATLNDLTPLGTWISSNASIATVDIFLGSVTGNAAGTATISYILPTGCFTTTVATVNPAPNVITGFNTVCTGATVTLSDIPLGGTWSSSNISVASIDTFAGIVTGGVVSTPSYVAITYTLPTGCSSSMSMVVYPPPAAITGTAHLCIGQSVLLSDVSPGGTWMASNGDAIMGASSGILTGVIAGTDTITYTISSGCTASIIATVNASPGTIIGTPSLCVGATTTLTDAGIGTWASSNLLVATVTPGTGVVNGVAAGTALITYSLGGSCVSLLTVTVNPLPTLTTVSGGGSYCAGGSGSHIYCGSSGASIAYQLYAAGVPVGAAITGTGGTLDFGLQTVAGAYTVFATNTVTGCSRTMTGSATITVNPPPATHAITGGGAICAGAAGVHIGLDAADAGVHYQLFLAGSAIGSSIAGTGGALDFGVFTSPGVYTAVATSTTTGCTATMAGTATISISALPTAYTVSGGGAYCAGASAPHIVLSSSASGISYQLFDGTASVGSTLAGTGTILDFGAQSASGIYTVVATNATTTCTHTMAGSASVTVNPVPSITGPTVVCVGASIAQTTAGFTGGAWSSSATSVATVSSSGVVYGVLTGSSATITYTASTGCSSTTLITVSPSPGPILSLPTVCQGSSVRDSDIVTGGSWTSGNAAVATVGNLTGIVYGVNTGTVMITYSLGTGCTVSKIMTVTPSPAVITGTMSLCAGTVTTLSDATAGGLWSSNNTAIAGVSGTGIVSGVSAGTASISYTSGGCFAATIITVNSTPVAISGPSVVCSGLTIAESDATTGGLWSSSTTSIATVDAVSGMVSGVSSGSTTITYSFGAGCATTKIITVTAGPAAITGTSGICLGSTVTLGETSTGGTWSSTMSTVATVSSAGVVTGSSTGTSTIIYSLGGCTTSLIVTVNPAPGVISGAATVCAGQVTTFTDPTGGGSWSSSNALVATIDGAGGVWGVAPGGIATVTYSLGGSCVVTRVITVNPLSAITGGTGVCVGATTNLADGTVGGTWHSGNTAVATVSSTGMVQGIAFGTATISYTTPLGCIATTVVTANSAPATITGATNICAGACSPLSDIAGGGAWSSSITAIATINASSGLVCGLVSGTTTVTYSLGFGCATSAVITVNALPSVITGSANICQGSAATLSSGTPGGLWSSSSTAVASVSVTGTVLGLSAGTSGITYTLPSGCSAATTVTIDPLPQPITGALSVCAGSSSSLSSTSSGGTWSSSNAGIAGIDIHVGTLTGIAPGTATITYTLPTGCAAVAVASVNTTPPAITGSAAMCVSSFVILTDALSGGLWQSGNTAVALVTASGSVSGAAVGTAAISYTVNGCTTSTTVSVNSLPAAILGNTHVCESSSTELADPSAGGSWFSSPAAIAAIDPVSGVVTGVSAGTATVIYSLGVGCSVSTIVTVDALPAAIAGNAQVCIGYTTALTSSGSGVWSSSNSSLASVNPAGVVTGLSGGGAIISFTNIHGCSATRFVDVIVVPAITGIRNMCAFGDSITVADAAPGGVWTSSSVSVSSVGVVTPFSAGVGVITYTMPFTGCFVSAPVTVNPDPGPVTGLSHLCVGQSGTLTDTTIIGTWSSSNAAMLPVTSSGHITGLAAGTATISFTTATGCFTTGAITVYSYPSVITGPSNVCPGGAITLSDSVGGGTWSSSNMSVAGISGSGILSGASPGVVTITYALAASCAVTKLVTVNSLPALFRLTGGGSYCSGGAGVHIGLSGSNSGTAYQLFDGATSRSIITGTGSAADFGLQTMTGTYTVVATNTTTSCISNMPGSVTVNITPAVIPSVLLSAEGGNIVCAGTPVTFSALPVNGGSSPAYEWLVNGVPTDSVTNTFTYTPSNADTITARLISSATCASPDTVSENIGMLVATPVPVIVTIAASPGTTVKTGDTISFSVVVTNGGATPSYQWAINNTPIPGATTATYSSSSLANGDSVSCIVIGSNICNVAGSASLIITINDNTNVSVATLNTMSDMAVLPNPNRGAFVIKGTVVNAMDDEALLEITDLLGQVVYKSVVEVKTGMINAQVKTGDALANGMYILTVRVGGISKTFHIAVSQ